MYKKAAVSIGNRNKLIKRLRNSKFETVIRKKLFIFIILYFKISMKPS
jgi:hypothetical protein